MCVVRTFSCCSCCTQVPLVRCGTCGDRGARWDVVCPKEHCLPLSFRIFLNFFSQTSVLVLCLLVVNKVRVCSVRPPTLTPLHRHVNSEGYT